MMDRMIEAGHRKGVGVKLEQERKEKRLLLRLGQQDTPRDCMGVPAT